MAKRDSLFRLASVALALAVCPASRGQSAFQNLVPGRNTQADAIAALGQPQATSTAAHLDFRPPAGLSSLAIDINAGAISRIEITLAQPIVRAALQRQFGLPQTEDGSKVDAKGKLIEFYAGSALLGLTYATGDSASGVERIEYFNQTTFASASGIGGLQATASAANFPNATVVSPNPPAAPKPAVAPNRPVAPKPPPLTISQPIAPQVSTNTPKNNPAAANPAAVSCFGGDAGAASINRQDHLTWATGQTVDVLIDNVRQKIQLLFSCPALPDDEVAEAFSIPSVILAVHTRDIRCFGGDAGATSFQQSSHRNWAAEHSREEVSRNLQEKARAALRCLPASKQAPLFADLSVDLAQTARFLR